MNMTEGEPHPQTEPVRRKRKQKRRTAPAEKPDVFAGVTATACCAACSEKGCVITGKPLCGHPYKSAVALADPKMAERVAEVRKILAHQKADALTR